SGVWSYSLVVVEEDRFILLELSSVALVDGLLLDELKLEQVVAIKTLFFIVIFHLLLAIPIVLLYPKYINIFFMREKVQQETVPYVSDLSLKLFG
ncbi:hypothetical protein ACJX0J_022072, partial [Zea mays]